MTKDEELIQEVLDFIKRPEMPKLWDEKAKWFKAVCDTVKVDGSRGYAVIKSINGYDYRIIKSFGSVAAIKSIENIRPFIMIQRQYFLKANNRDEVIDYMVNKYGEERKEEIANMDRESLAKLCYADAIEAQTESEKSFRDYYENQYMRTRDIDNDQKDIINKIFNGVEVPPFAVPDTEEDEEPNEEIEERKNELAEMQKKAKYEKRGRKSTKKD